MLNDAWLSVIIPTYNGEKYLTTALETIVIQNDSNLECIVIDDGSTDSTLSIINSYKDKLPLKIIQNERTGNWVKNTNYALSQATSEYVCFLHQDDLWLPNRLKIIKSLIDRYPTVNFFLHPSWFVDSQGNHLGLWKCPLPHYPKLTRPSLMKRRLLVQNFISIPAPIFKRKLALEVGGLDEILWYTADWDFWLKTSAGSDIIYYPQPLSAFRIHGDSQTVVRSSYLSEFRHQLETVLNRYFRAGDISLPNVKTLKRIALFSIEVNITLAGLVHKQKVELGKLIISFLGLGVLGWYQYFRDSRIWDRVYSRLKTKLIATKKR